jgi:hypothetical protein
MLQTSTALDEHVPFSNLHGEHAELLFPELGMDPRTWQMLSKPSTTEQYSQPFQSFYTHRDLLFMNLLPY